MNRKWVFGWIKHSTHFVFGSCQLKQWFWEKIDVFFLFVCFVFSSESNLIQNHTQNQFFFFFFELFTCLPFKNGWLLLWITFGTFICDKFEPLTYQFDRQLFRLLALISQLLGIKMGNESVDVYECSGTNIFIRWKTKCSIQLCENGIFLLSPNEIFVPLHKWENIHYLFYITCTKIQILEQIQKKKL